MNRNLICLMFFISASTYADKIEVFREPFKTLGSLSAKFEIDREHPQNERAWIEVIVDGNLKWNKNIPGLKFNHLSEEITYTDGTSAPVVCARQETSKFLFVHSKELVETGKCVLTIQNTQEKNELPEGQELATITMEIDQNRSISSGEKMTPISSSSVSFSDRHGR